MPACIRLGETSTRQIFSFSFRRSPVIDAILLTGHSIPTDPLEIAGRTEMTRSPRVDSACRFFPEIVARPAPTASPCAGASGSAWRFPACGAARAQSPAKGSPEHIKAVTSAVDGASIKANTATSNDWPTIGLDYAETRFSKLNQINTDNVKKLGLVWSYPLRILPRRRGDADRGRRHHVPDRVMERGARRSTRAPASGSGPTIRRSTGRRATRAAATSSIAASRSGRARSLSAPMTAG